MGHFWFCVSYNRRLFPSKISPTLNITDLHPKVTYCYSKGSAVSRRIEFTIYCWIMDTGLMGLCYIFRSSMACPCLALSALSKSRNDFYLSPKAKRPQGKASRCQPRTRSRQVKPIREAYTAFFSWFLSTIAVQECCVPPSESKCSDIVGPLGCSKTPGLVWTLLVFF